MSEEEIKKVFVNCSCGFKQPMNGRKKKRCIMCGDHLYVLPKN